MKKIGQYFKVFFRHFLKNKIYSLFSLISLVVALTTCLIIMTYTHHEYFYDRFHENHDEIYRVLMSDSMQTNLYAQVCYPVTNYFKRLPEVEQSVIIKNTDLSIKIGEEFVTEKDVLYTQSSFFSLFDFYLLSGTANSLNSPGNIFVSESFSERISPDKNITGSNLEIKTNSGNTKTLKIAGIFKDLPQNSHLQAEVLMPFKILEPYFNKESGFKWNSNSIYYYLQTSQNKENIEYAINQNILTDIKESKNIRFKLQPLDKVHLFSNHIELNLEDESVFSELLISIGIAFLIIFIALTNYIIYILSVANSRIGEIIVRKAIGATKKNLYNQIIWESLFQLVIALPFVLFLTVSLIPDIESYFDFKINMEHFYKILTIFFSVILLIGLIAGTIVSSYLVLPSLNRLRTYFNNSGAMNVKGGQIITIVQLSLCIACIVGLFTIRKQLNFAMDSGTIGFNYKNQISVHVNNRQLIRHWDSFKGELLKNPEIESVAACMSSPPAFSTDMAGFKWMYDENGKKYGYMKMGLLNDKDRAEFEEVFEKNNISADYFKALGINTLKGRGFDNARNESKNIIVNKAFVKKHQLDNPLNKTISFLDSKFKIIGIVNNFKTKSIFKKKEPIVFFHTDKYFRQVVIRYSPKQKMAALNKIQETWNEIIPGTPLDYQFTDTVIENYYQKEKKLADFINFFTLLAIVLTIINLIGYSRLSFNNREKEIGIRRVFGAGSRHIIADLLKPYFYYLLISLIAGIFISSYFLINWFKQFTQSAELNYSEYLYILVGTGFLLMSLIFINIKIIMKKNPVKSLRYE